jgi:hypothetical protein
MMAQAVMILTYKTRYVWSDSHAIYNFSQSFQATSSVIF